MCVVQRSAWASMNTDASAAAAAVFAAAPAVLRVVKRRKLQHETQDEHACERLLEGDGEVAAALRVYAPSDGEYVDQSESCESDNDVDDVDDEEDDDEADVKDICNDGNADGRKLASCQVDTAANAADSCTL